MLHQDRRIQSRFDTNVDVILFNQTESFKTRSLNVSMSGALLENLVPVTFMKKPIELVIILPNQRRLLIKALMVGGNTSARLMFLGIKKDAESFLEDYLRTLETFV